MSDWISVCEELPTIPEDQWRTDLPVNIMVEGFGQHVAYPCQKATNEFVWRNALTFGNDKGEHPDTDDDCNIIGVTHWMYLPQPPTE